MIYVVGRRDSLIYRLLPDCILTRRVKREMQSSIEIYLTH